MYKIIHGHFWTMALKHSYIWVSMIIRIRENEKEYMTSKDIQENKWPQSVTMYKIWYNINN